MSSVLLRPPCIHLRCSRCWDHQLQKAALGHHIIISFFPPTKETFNFPLLESSLQFSKQSPRYLPPLPPIPEAIPVHQKERTMDILLGPRFLQQLIGLSGQNIHLSHPVCYSWCKPKLSSIHITLSFLVPLPSGSSEHLQPAQLTGRFNCPRYGTAELLENSKGWSVHAHFLQRLSYWSCCEGLTDISIVSLSRINTWLKRNFTMYKLK